MTGANITCVVDNLEKDLLVTRVHSKRDRRIILAELTVKGRELIEKILPDFESKTDDIMSRLSDEEKDQLVKLLDKFFSNGRS